MNDGKAFEAELHLWLKSLAKRRPLAVHRFQDTRAARRQYLPSQPGDFLVVVNSRAILLETKSSRVHDSLRAGWSKLIPAAQIGHFKIWQRAGAATFFLFNNGLIDRYEVWSGYQITQAKADGARLSCRPLAAAGHRAKFQNDLEQLLLGGHDG